MQSLANTLWSLADLGIKPPQAWLEVALASVFDQPMEAFLPQEISSIMWALGKLRCRGGRALDPADTGLPLFAFF